MYNFSSRLGIEPRPTAYKASILPLGHGRGLDYHGNTSLDSHIATLFINSLVIYSLVINLLAICLLVIFMFSLTSSAHFYCLRSCASKNMMGNFIRFKTNVKI